MGSLRHSISGATNANEFDLKNDDSLLNFETLFERSDISALIHGKGNRICATAIQRLKVDFEQFMGISFTHIQYNCTM